MNTNKPKRKENAASRNNRAAVYNWFVENPGGNVKECAAALGYCRPTVSKWRKIIVGGWRPEPETDNLGSKKNIFGGAES